MAMVMSLLAVAQQQTTGTLSGTVLTGNQEPVPAATVQIRQLKKISQTDSKGKFQLAGIPLGEHTLEISIIGYKTIKKKVTVRSSNQALSFELTPTETSLEGVSVMGYSETQLSNRQAYNVTAIDAKKLHNSTLDIAHVLDRVTGVRVRESGGVGSDFNFSINGFSGSRVKFFLDGIPMENFGSSIQINNIPINFAERVEVYKGVVPVWLGSDALGGAVNIITGSKLRNFLDVSYSYGSFNTHRTNINAGITSKKGLTFQLNAFQNYSDNNYKVTVDAADIHTGQYYPNTTVRRFHDQYHNETLIAQTGFLDKQWADRFLVGITLGQNYKEIQTGARMVSVFGAWHTRGNTVMPTFKYQKDDLFIKGLNVAINANYNFGKENNIDTVYARYGWLGDSITFNGKGGERSRMYYKYGNNIATASATITYKINEKQLLAFNNVFSRFNRKGRDLLAPEDDKYQQPQKAGKNILGLSYKLDVNKKWSTTVFGKYIYQKSKTTFASDAGGEPTYKNMTTDINKPGYGIATSYYILPSLQAKLSYEKTNRMPENEDLFGDLINREKNFDLKPESSDNINLGISYSFKLDEDHRFITSAMGIYRKATDYIYYTFNNNQTKLIARNLDGVSNKGVEAEVRYSYKKFLAAGINFTYQDIRNLQKYDPGYTNVSEVYKDRMPNLPYMYGNADASVFIKNVFDKGDQLSIGYNMLYVHAFYLYWPSRGSSETKYGIPEQLSHDMNIVYAMKGGKYNISFECRNITDAMLYDNFSLQKPGRAFSAKLRYFISK
ncbi:TonB-dependent receptor [Chitinophaga caeni]|nr:TonB-dependent receptor [Chitinophaga caeni]